MTKSLHHKLYSQIIARLISEREERRFSQIDLGAKLGITQSAVSKIERLERRLDVYEFIQWCDTLGISAAEVVRDFEAPKRRRSK